MKYINRFFAWLYWWCHFNETYVGLDLNEGQGKDFVRGDEIYVTEGAGYDLRVIHIKADTLYCVSELTFDSFRFLFIGIFLGVAGVIIVLINFWDA